MCVCARVCPITRPIKKSHGVCPMIGFCCPQSGFLHLLPAGHLGATRERHIGEQKGKHMT